MMYAAIALAAAGALLLILGLRGRRIDDHPICRRCRFDLVGIHGREPRCPECGSEISKPRAVRIGHRRVRRRLAAAGGIILLAGLLASAVLGWAAAAGADWNTYKPEWWLAADVRAGGAAADGALRELEERLREGRLSREHIPSMIELAMLHQQDESLAWSEAWEDFLETARRWELLMPEQLQQYIETAASPSLRMRPRMMQALPWGMQVHIRHGRIAARNDLQLRMSTTGLWVNEQQVDDREVTRGMLELAPAGRATSTFAYSTPRLLSLAPGEYNIRVDMRFTVVDQGQNEAYVGEWTEEFTSTLRIVRPGESVIELVTDESLRPLIEGGIESQFARLSADDRRGEGMLLIRGLPIDVVFNIYWLFEDPDGPEGEREVRMGAISVRAGKQVATRYSRLLDPDPVPERIDIILRPSPTAPGSRTAFDTIWGEAVIIRDVILTSEADEDPP